MTWKLYKLKGDTILEMPMDQLKRLTVRRSIEEPILLRHDTPEGPIRYCGNEEMFRLCETNNKNPSWLHDYFEGVKEKLVKAGWRPEASLLDYEVGHLFNVLRCVKIIEGTAIIDSQLFSELKKPVFGEKR